MTGIITNKKSYLKIAGFFTALALSFGANAQNYPSETIHLIAPFKPGGAVDTTSRIIAQYANKDIDGLNIKVEDRAGGGGVVGQTLVAKSKADGYTVLAMTSSVVTNPKLKQIDYKLSDFKPVAMYTYDPEVIVVSAQSKIKNIQQFIDQAKQKTLTITDAGNGTSHHLSGLALKDNAHLKLKFIHTKGFGAQLQAIIGGHTDAGLWAFGEAKPYFDAGTVRILAVATPSRVKSHPEIPTWNESGLNIDQWATFRGWAVPTGTPDSVVAYLSNILKRVNSDKQYLAKMNEEGFPIVYKDAVGYAKVIHSYDVLTTPLVKELKK